MKKQDSKKYVYFFGAGQTEGNANMRELLGGKGANLAEMAGLGLPVPQGFTITTEACTRYYDDGKKIGTDIQKQVGRGTATAASSRCSPTSSWRSARSTSRS